MAIYRNIQTSFWTDAKVVDDFEPEDKLFFLYLMTNPYTSLSGCYSISISHVALETGFSKDKVRKLIEKASNTLNIIRYSPDTGEILILNWYKYNWTNSEKFRKPLYAEIEHVKNESFRKYLEDAYNGIDTVLDTETYGIDTVSEQDGYGMDTVSDQDGYGMDTPCSVLLCSDTDRVGEIVDYLNTKTGKKYRATTQSTRESINARLRDGYTVEDCKAVIDTKVEEWMGNPEFEKYLTPDTLFRPSKFEKYLNQSIKSKPPEKPPEKPPDRNAGLQKVVEYPEGMPDDSEEMRIYDADMDAHPYDDGWRINDDGYWVNINGTVRV